LIDALNEKDRLLEKKEDLLYEEHDKFVEVEKFLALAMKKNELLSSELSSCHGSIYSLESTKVNLNARIEKLSVASSSLEHVSICNRCKDFDIDACNDHVSTISKLTNDIAKLHVQLKICKDKCENIKFARVSYTIGRYPSIKDGLGFHGGAKDIKSHKVHNFIKEKGMAPMASSSHSSHDRKNYAYGSHNAYIIHHDACFDDAMPAMRHDVVYSSHAMIASSSSSYANGRPTRHNHVVSHAPKASNASHGLYMLFLTFDASYVLYCKNGKVVASNVGPKCKKGKSCIWVPKSYVTNLTGPNTSWRPKPQA
jgi:hypothetical protein